MKSLKILWIKKKSNKEISTHYRWIFLYYKNGFIFDLFGLLNNPTKRQKDQQFELVFQFLVLWSLTHNFGKFFSVMSQKIATCSCEYCEQMKHIVVREKRKFVFPFFRSF